MVSYLISLPPLEVLSFNKVYYALVLEGDGIMTVYGSGRTIEECRNDVINKRLYSEPIGERLFITLSNSLVRCNLDLGVPAGNNTLSVFTIRLCDAKTHIYGHRYGHENLICGLNPYIIRPFLSFVEYRKSKKSVGDVDWRKVMKAKGRSTTPAERELKRPRG